MARIYIIRVFDAAGRLVASQETQAGSGVTGGGPLRIAAGAGYRLEVVDPLSGAAPRKLLVRRNGSSLELYLEDDALREGATCADCDGQQQYPGGPAGDAPPPDVVVEGFYGPSGPQAQLVGFSAGGLTELYPAPERDGSFCWSELGAESCGEDISPSLLWLLLLGGAGAAAVAVAASGGGGGGSGDDGGGQPQPGQPEQRVAVVSIIDDEEPVLGVVPDNGPTNDRTPTLLGTLSAALKPGEYVAIYRDGVLVGRASLEADGSNSLTWSFTDNLAGQADGRYTYTARVVNEAGGQGPESAGYSMILDTTPPPGSVAINSYLDNVEPNVGEFGEGTPTNDATPLLLGSVTGLEAGDRVLIFLDGELLGQAVLDGRGGWSFQVEGTAARALGPGGLTEGSHTFTAVIEDAAGNRTSSEPFTLVVDLTAPSSGNSVTIEAYEDDVPPLVGDFGDGSSTNDPSPLLKGTVTGLTPGDLILIFSDGVLLGQAEVSGGSWSFQVTGLETGPHSFTAVITDAAGNRGTASDVFTLTVQDPPPIGNNAVQITSYVDDQELNVGEFTSPIPTNDQTPVLKGVVSGLNPGDYVLIYQGATLLAGRAVVNMDGTWTYAITGPLTEDDYVFTAVIANDAGGEGTRSAQFHLTVDLTPPTSGAVAITHYTDDVEPNAGNYPTGTYTNDRAPVLHGTASGLEAGDIILIYEGATLLGRTRVNRAGTWAFQLENLSEGPHTFRAEIADAAGNRGSISGDFTLNVDIIPPTIGNAVAITGYRDDQEPNVGNFSEDEPTNDTSPLLLGSVSGLNSGDVVLIFGGTSTGGTPLGTASLDGLGGWSFQLNGLTEGSHTFTAVIADAAGNRGTVSGSFTITVDLTPPTQGNAVEITAYRDGVEPNAGDFNSGVPTNDSSPLLVGTVSGLQPGERVLIFQDGVLLGEANLERSVNWTYQLGVLTEGRVYKFTAVIVDAAGNRGTASAEFEIVVDLTPPTSGNSISITGYHDDRLPNTGDFNLDTPTNDAAPLLRGTVNGLQDGDVVLIFRGTDFSSGVAPLGQATVVNGAWTFQLSGLSEGSNQFTAVIADAAGNRGSNASGAIVLDTTPPTSGTVSITAYYDNVDPNTGEFGQAVPTNDTTPLLVGTFSGLNTAAGEYILVYHGSILLGQARLSGASTWEIQVTVPLDEGVHVFTAVICDAAGNQGSRSNNFMLTVDTTPPTQGNSVAITGYEDDVELNTGDFGSGVPTNDASPLLKGTASGLQAGDKVLLYQDGVFLAELTVNALGEWEYQLNLAEGSYVYRAVIVDAAGNQGTASADFSLVVDLTGPTDNNSVAITFYQDQQEPETGDFGSDDPTDDASPILKGTVTGLQPGDVVLIYQDGVLLGRADLDGSGGWTYQLLNLAEGTYIYTARIADAAGNPGTTSNDFTLTVEFAPQSGEIVITSYYDDVGINTGDFGPGTATDDELPLLKGTVTGLDTGAGQYIRIYDGLTLLGTATITGAGTWEFQVTADLSEGEHFFTAVITAANGTEGTSSNYFKLTVDLAGPTTGNSVAITAYLDGEPPQVGEFPSSIPTNDTSPLLKGTLSGLEPGGAVLIYQNGLYLGQAVIDNNTWSYQLTGLTDGNSYLYQAYMADAAGNRGTASNQFTIVVDTAPPLAGNAVAIISYYDDTPLNVGDFGSGVPTNDPSPLLKGTVSGLQAGDVVRVYRDGTFLGLASLDGSGGWTYQVYGLTEGSHTFTAQIADAAGNLGTTSAGFEIILDLTPPDSGNSVAVTGYRDDVDPNQGDFGPGVPTNDTSPLLQGTVSGLQAGDQVLIYQGGVLLGPATVDTASGSWTYQLNGLSDGSYTYTAVIADAAGNLGTSSDPFELVVDQTPPTSGNNVAITAYIDDEPPQVGEFPSSTPTNDASPLLKGTVSGLQSGDIVRIYQGGTLLGTARLDGRGGWTYQVTGLAAGVYVFTAVIADAAGNEGTRSADFTLAVDLTPPTATAGLDSITEDTGLLDNDFITADQTLVFSIVTTGAMAAGDRVQISLDGGATWLDAVYNAVTGTWQYDNTGTVMDEGSYNVLTRVVDAAGNAGGESAQTVTIDLSSPDTVSTVTHFADDFGPYQNAVLPSGAYTDDKTPELHGTLSAALQNGERLAVYLGTTFLGYADVTGQNWSFTDARGTLENGKAYVYRTAVVNAVGNLGETSNEFEVRIDETDTNLAPSTGVNPDQSFSTALMLGPDGQWVILSDQTIWEAQNRKDYSGTTLSMDGLSGHAGGSSYGRIAFGSWSMADYNKDGHMDIFTTDNVHSGNSMTIYQGGAGGYTPALIRNGSIEGALSLPNELHLGTVISLDINGDGYIDVIIGDSGSDSSTFLLNKGAAGSGDSLAGQWYAMGHRFGQTSGALAGLIMDHELSGVDLNNDGAVDFVAHAYNASGGQIHSLSVLLNSGETSTNGSNWTLSQVFERIFNYSGTGDDTYLHTISLTWGDFNGDGYMDLFMGQSQDNGTRTNNNLIFYNNGDGTLAQPQVISDTVTGQFSLALDWNGDGFMDIIEVPEYGNSLSLSQLWLNTGTTRGPNQTVWDRISLGDAGAVSTGSGRVSLGSYNNGTGLTAVDYDWDGDIDVIIATQGNTPSLVVNNPNTPDYGTALHLRILAGDGSVSFYGNTVMLYDADGNFVASQIINPQSGMGMNDSSALVHFFGLDPNQTYTALLLRNTNGASNDVGGLPQFGANTVENVNSTWSNLKPGEANKGYVLTAESDSASSDTLTAISGTGYNDVFFATRGTKIYNGGGGTTEINGVREWSADGGMDVVDYQLAGNQAVTVDLGRTGAQNTGFNTATFTNIEGIYGASGNDVFTGNSGNNFFNGRGGNDTYILGNGGRDTIIFELLEAADAVGGNGLDTVRGFTVGRFGSNTNADRIDISELLIGYRGDVDGAAHYVNGRAEIDPGDRIGDYLSVRQEGANSVLYLDRDGQGGAHAPTALLVIENVSTDLATLLANEQIVLY